MIHEALAIGWFVGGAIWKVLPAFLISIAFGVLIRALALDGFIRRAVDARVGVAVVLATAVGAFSPLCSCTVIPVISGLLLSGVPLAPVMSFWIASPTMDPEMFALTVATLGWPLAIARLAATLVLSVGAGYLTLALTRSGLLSMDVLHPRMLPRPSPSRLPSLSLPVLQPATVGAPSASSSPAALPAPPARVRAFATVSPMPAISGSCCGASADAPAAGRVETAVAAAARDAAPALAACCGTSGGATSVSRFASVAPVGAAGCGAASVAVSGSAGGALVTRLRAIRWPAFVHDMAANTWRLGRWLVLAFVLEAVMLRYVPQAAVAGVLGEGSSYAVLLAAVIGIPLYLNNVSALPIVSGLLAQGMQPGAAVAFLIAGPVTTIPAMSAVWGIVKGRIFALYVGVALVGAVLFGWLTNLLLG